MSKPKYLALADLQELWTNKIKPSLPTKTTVDDLSEEVDDLKQRLQVKVEGKILVIG